MSDDFGITRFTYTQEQARYIYVLLRVNGGNVVKVFSIIWHEPAMFPNIKEDAPLILELIESLSFETKRFPEQSFDQYWSRFCESTKESKFVTHE